MILKQLKYQINDFVTKTKKMSVKNALCIVFGLGALIYAGAVIPSRLSISTTNSVGYHFFYCKKKFKTKELKKDTMVIIPLYTKLIENCWPCLATKYIRCDEGDLLNAQNGSFFCNNIYLGSSKTHSKKGESLNSFNYDGIIPENQFFAMGTCIDSYDSKYMGLINKNDVKAIAIPVF